MNACILLNINQMNVAGLKEICILCYTHPLSAVRDCIFNIFVAIFHMWRPCPPSTFWGRAMPWWQGPT